MKAIFHNPENVPFVSGKIIVFRRGSDGLIFFKTPDNRIYPVVSRGCEVYSILYKMKDLSEMAVEDMTGQNLSIISHGKEEIIFLLDTQGECGAEGPPGPMGPCGPEGAKGAQGEPGFGSRGSQGAQGSIGPSGATGAQGAQGATGASGANSQTIMYGAFTFNPADSTGYVVGSLPGGVPATTFTRKVIIRAGGTITGFAIGMNQTAGSAETSTINLYVNGVFAQQMTNTFTNDSAFTSFVRSNLAIPVNAGDNFEVQWATPAWATNPTGVIIWGHIQVTQ